MKILVINSNTNKEMTERLHETALATVSDGTAVETVCARRGVETVECSLDAAYAAPATAELVEERRSDFDAFVIACYSDPGLFACRELTNKPVLGIAQSSMLAAAALGHKFSVLSPLDRMKPTLWNLVRLYGMEKLCASVRTVNVSVLDSFINHDSSNNSFAREARLAAEMDGAEAVCLGGAIFAGRDREISELCAMPCIDGLSAALKMAEMYVSLGYSTSKRCFFGDPPPKPRCI